VLVAGVHVLMLSSGAGFAPGRLDAVAGSLSSAPLDGWLPVLFQWGR
jgi:hypothetical protein